MDSPIMIILVNYLTNIYIYMKIREIIYLLLILLFIYIFSVHARIIEGNTTATPVTNQDLLKVLNYIKANMAYNDDFKSSILN